MFNNPKNECKLMILYLLRNLDFPLNHSGLSNFFLDTYASYISFQEMVSELIETGLVSEIRTKTSVCYKTTADGIDTVDIFINEISDEHKKEIDEYIKENKFRLKERTSTIADYTEGKNDSILVSLKIMEDNNEVINISMDVPSIDVARTMCEKWKIKSKNIYHYFIKELL